MSCGSEAPSAHQWCSASHSAMLKRRMYMRAVASGMCRRLIVLVISRRRQARQTATGLVSEIHVVVPSSHSASPTPPQSGDCVPNHFCRERVVASKHPSSSMMRHLGGRRSGLLGSNRPALDLLDDWTCQTGSRVKAPRQSKAKTHTPDTHTRSLNFAPDVSAAIHTHRRRRRPRPKLHARTNPLLAHSRSAHARTTAVAAAAAQVRLFSLCLACSALPCLALPCPDLTSDLSQSACVVCSLPTDFHHPSSFRSRLILASPAKNHRPTQLDLTWSESLAAACWN
jgi:hypothetical protein